MVIFGVYIVSKSGGLIFNHDHSIPKVENERVFNYPIDLKLEFDAKKVIVAYGQKDGINGEEIGGSPSKDCDHKIPFQLATFWLDWMAAQWLAPL